ncbi:hypothetical protein F7734_60405 [Scytonema sp. UIC 10036]|nr:hypothetical protein [Scytonema sp. UIC 10036]
MQKINPIASVQHKPKLPIMPSHINPNLGSWIQKLQTFVMADIRDYCSCSEVKDWDTAS